MTEPNPTATAEPAPPKDEPGAAGAILPLMRLLPPPPLGAIVAPPEAQEPARRTWVLAQLWGELRLAAQMYFDSRYRISRLAQVAFPALLGLFVLNYFLFAVWFSLPVVSPVAERLVSIALAVVGYRILLRELEEEAGGDRTRNEIVRHAGRARQRLARGMATCGHPAAHS
jgi:hypothetical protein